MVAERCHCGHEGVTVVKEEVVKLLEKQFQGLYSIYPCVRAKWDGVQCTWGWIQWKFWGWDVCLPWIPKIHCSTLTSTLNNWLECIKARNQERYFLFTIAGHAVHREAISMHHHVMAVFCNSTFNVAAEYSHASSCDEGCFIEVLVPFVYVPHKGSTIIASKSIVFKTIQCATK